MTGSRNVFGRCLALGEMQRGREQKRRGRERERDKKTGSASHLRRKESR
jgi:hypothetical protein